MLTYNSYHSELKCPARENLLAQEICALIPRSNIWRWKHEPADKYKSFDLNLKASQDYELIRSFANNKKAKRVFSAYVRLCKFFLELVHDIPKFHKYVRAVKLQVVKTIDRVKNTSDWSEHFGFSTSPFPPIDNGVSKPIPVVFILS